MKRVHTHLHIPAPSHHLWSILADLNAWPTWNPIIPKMAAEPRLGGRVRFTITLRPNQPLRFSARIVRWDPGYEIAWGGGVPRVATGEHYFRLEPIDDHHTRLVHGEDFNGLIPALTLIKPLRRRIADGYERMNRALADEASQRAIAQRAVDTS